jgi:hypothetical protein
MNLEPGDTASVAFPPRRRRTTARLLRIEPNDYHAVARDMGVWSARMGHRRMQLPRKHSNDSAVNGRR